jgi:hypothetical protein
MAARRLPGLLLILLVVLGAVFDSRSNSPPPNAFDQALRRGDLRRVRHLLDAGEPVDQPLPYNNHAGESRPRGYMTPLACAVEDDNAEMVELLLTYGANPNTVGRSGGSLLDIARTSGSPKVVRLLRQAGARWSLNIGTARKAPD